MQPSNIAVRRARPKPWPKPRGIKPLRKLIWRQPSAGVVLPSRPKGTIGKARPGGPRVEEPAPPILNAAKETPRSLELTGRSRTAVRGRSRLPVPELVPASSRQALATLLPLRRCFAAWNRFRIGSRERLLQRSAKPETRSGARRPSRPCASTGRRRKHFTKTTIG